MSEQHFDRAGRMFEVCCNDCVINLMRKQICLHISCLFAHQDQKIKSETKERPNISKKKPVDRIQLYSICKWMQTHVHFNRLMSQWIDSYWIIMSAYSNRGPSNRVIQSLGPILYVQNLMKQIIIIPEYSQAIIWLGNLFDYWIIVKTQNLFSSWLLTAEWQSVPSKVKLKLSLIWWRAVRFMAGEGVFQNQIY